MKPTSPSGSPPQGPPRRGAAKKGPKSPRADLLAHKSLQPSVQAALTVHDYNKNFGELSIKTLVDELGNQCALASTGDLTRAEAILMAQAHTLDAIFHRLARKATSSKLLDHFEMELRMALKAQSQCRATLETLATIKNPPPVAFVRQANITTGVLAIPPRAERIISQSKLLEEKNGQRVDSEAPSAATGADCSMEALGTLNWSPNRRRQVSGF
jgi:hypothetical protein